MRDYRLYLVDIVKCSEKIQRYTTDISFDDFLTDDMKVDAVERNLEKIGEAVQNLPSVVRDRFPEIEWQDIGGLRNLLAHGYYKVNKEVLWRIVQNDVLPLRTQVEQILDSEGITNPLTIAETSFAPTSPTGSRSKSIYPKQQERAAIIVPIARQLLETGREQNASLQTRETSPGVEEIDTSDYKIELNNNTQPSTLTLFAKDERGTLLRTRLEAQTDNLELAGKIIPKDVNKWLEIKQKLDKNFH